MDDDRFKRLNNLLTLLAVIGGLVASVFGFVNQQRTSALEKDIAQLDRQLKMAEVVV